MIVSARISVDTFSRGSPAVIAAGSVESSCSLVGARRVATRTNGGFASAAIGFFDEPIQTRKFTFACIADILCIRNLACIFVRTTVVGIIGFACTIKCMEIVVAFKSALSVFTCIVGIFDVACMPVYTAVIDIIWFTAIFIIMRIGSAIDI